LKKEDNAAIPKATTSVSAADNRVLLCDLCLIVLPVSASCNDPEALLVKHVEPMQGSCAAVAVAVGGFGTFTASEGSLVTKVFAEAAKACERLVRDAIATVAR